MAGPSQSLKSNYYHQTLELHLRCGAEVLRNLVNRKIELSGGTLKSHLNLPRVRKKINSLHPRFLRPDQFQLIYPEPKLLEMDITLLSCLILNGDFSLSVTETDKVQRLRKERNDLSHIPKPELDDKSKFNVGSNLIDEIACSVGKDYQKHMKAAIAEIQQKELVTCHCNHEVVLLRGEIYMTKLIERPGKDESVDASDTTYLRFAMTKWAERFTRSVNMDAFLQKLKKEGVVSAEEKRMIQTRYSKGEQYNELVLKMVDKPDFDVLNFFKSLRAYNSDLADLLENKGDDGKSIENELKNIERDMTKAVLRCLFQKAPTGEVRFEELQVAVEEKLGHDVDFSSLEYLVVQEFTLNQPKDQDYSFKGIVWTKEGDEVFNRCSIVVNDSECSQEDSSEPRFVLDMRYDEFATFVETEVNDIMDGYGQMIGEALIKECISPSTFAYLTKEEIEESVYPYLRGKRLIMGVRKKMQELQQKLLLELTQKRQQTNSEIFCDLRPFDAPPGQAVYQIGKVTFATGNLLVPVHECRILPTTRISTTTYIVSETLRFLAACLNSRRNGTIHFGIEDKGLSCGFVKGLKVLPEQSAARLNSYVSRGIDICFEVKDVSLVKSCVRPFQLVQTAKEKVVLELDVVPSTSCTNGSFFTIKFPPKARQQDVLFVYNEETPCEIVSVSGENVTNTIHIYQRNVKIRAQLEQETKDRRSCSSTIEKLRLRLTAGSEYCTEQHIPVLCCGKLTDIADETFIRNQLDLHASNAFLSSFAVLDFDTCTKQRKSVEKNMSLQFMVKTTESIFDLDQDEADRYWIYCNGNSDLDIPPFSENEWYRRRLPILRDAMTVFREYIPSQRGLVICLVFDKPSPRDPMIEFMKDCMNLQFRNECVVITDSEQNIEDLRRDVCSRMMPEERTREHFFAGITWQDIAEVLRSVFQSPEILDIRLPCSSGKEVFLSKQYQAEMKLTDIEILSGKFYQEEEQVDDDETRRKHELNEKEKFYRGEEVSWWNFHYNSHVGERNLFQTYRNMIREKLREEREKLIETQVIFHQPGAGGTTAGKYLLWHLSQFKFGGIRDSYRCCVVKSITENTASQIYEFLSFEDRNPKPVVALIDNATDDAIDVLKLDLNELAYRKLHSQSHLFCLLIIIKRVSVSYSKPSDIVLRHELSRTEKTWFENKYKELENNDEIDVETLISFNVMRESFDERFIKDLTVRFLKDVTDTETEVLKCLSLINTFDRDNAVPISIFDSLGHSNHAKSPYQFNLYDYVGKGPRGLVVPIAKNIRRGPRMIWNTRMSESMSLLIKRSHGSTARHSVGNVLQHDGIMIISQALAKAVLDNIMATENIPLSKIVEYVLTMVKAHVQELNPMSKEFVRIINSLFKTRQLRSEKGDTKEKFSDMIMELKKGPVDKDTNGCDTVIYLMNLCFDITQDAMVGQQLSRFYIDMKRFDKAEEIIKKSIMLQPKNSYLLDTYGQIFYSRMAHQLSQWSQDSVSITVDQASDIIKTAFEAIQKFQTGQEVTFEEEGGGNNSCFVMVVKTSLELLENFSRFSSQQNEKDLVSFLNDLSIDIKDTAYFEIGKRCSIEELRLSGKIHIQIENSLRMLEERQYQLKHNFYTINTTKGEQLLLDLRERYERFYGNAQTQDDYKFKYGIGLKSIMTVYNKDKYCLDQRVDKAVININYMERFDRMQKIDRRDLLVFLGYEIVKMSLKGAQEEPSEPIPTSVYEQLLKCSKTLLELEKKEKKKQTHRPHLEAYLYFTILNWPSETRGIVDNICQPSQLKNALTDWETAFQGNFRQSSQIKRRAFPKTYFALGNRELGCDIVDFSKVELIWRNKRNKRRNYVKDDQVFKEPFVTDILKRLDGTLNHNGTLVHYRVGRQHWHYSIDIKTYKSYTELSSRQVTFILVFTWAGPRAYDILEYEDDLSKSKEPFVATNTGQKMDQIPNTPCRTGAASNLDNQEDDLSKSKEPFVATNTGQKMDQIPNTPCRAEAASSNQEINMADQRGHRQSKGKQKRK